MTQPIDTLRSPDRVASSDERVLAGVAHLAICGGFWLFVPLGIFLIKRKDSPFVAFHALQATLLALAAIPLGIASWVGALILPVVAVLVFGRDAEPLFGVFFLGAAVVPVIVIGSTGFFAGVRAFRGRTWSIPFVGRFARSILAGPSSLDDAQRPE